MEAAVLLYKRHLNSSCFCGAAASRVLMVGQCLAAGATESHRRDRAVKLSAIFFAAQKKRSEKKSFFCKETSRVSSIFKPSFCYTSSLFRICGNIADSASDLQNVFGSSGFQALIERLLSQRTSSAYFHNVNRT